MKSGVGTNVGEEIAAAKIVRAKIDRAKIDRGESVGARNVRSVKGAVATADGEIAAGPIWHVPRLPEMRLWPIARFRHSTRGTRTMRPSTLPTGSTPQGLRGKRGEGMKESVDGGVGDGGSRGGPKQRRTRVPMPTIWRSSKPATRVRQAPNGGVLNPG